MFITSPEAFADIFNEKFPGAYRQITYTDVRLMTDCRLIGKYKYYPRDDLETVRRILQYEKLRDSQTIRQEKEKKQPTCKMCGEPLRTIQEGMSGRPKEYCSTCEPMRNRERQKRRRSQCRN